MRPATTEIHYNPDLTQIINGEEVMSPSPKPSHQRIVSRLYKALDRHVETNHLGEVFFAPLDVILEEGFNRVQPDIMFISNANAGILIEWVHGAPDLAIEVISPGSVKLDTVTKKLIYARYGVPEFWIVFPARKIIEVYVNVSGDYELFAAFSNGSLLKSPILPGLSIAMDSIFE